ncbi:folate-binding protein [Burkholderiaceae bacterium FT117]|uniref:CAF17-like 4Fe-4S cluster assembly/insertion protein YgfZ n=1 Tax=Zeimonas sediminis TaxID=2944268 RepID=UPI002342D411|nr:folate-binding protein [Zeimonas sediminis]MCM5569246.1 folate-binding protein [Zeimonas sediminis]
MTSILTPSYDESAVRDAIAQCGASFRDDPHGPQAEFPTQPAGDSPVAAGDPSTAAGDAPATALAGVGRVALLADWGLVSVSGADAVSFLQGQTTNDVAAQAADEVRWNGYCTPKGRLLAAGPLWRDGEALRFAVSRPLAEPLRKRLSMFVLRAKAKVEDASNAFAILGLTGEPAADALRELGVEPPAPMRCASAGDGGPLAIGFPAVGGIGPRWWLVVASNTLGETWRRLAARLAPASSSWWRAGEILAGEPRIVPATSESFVPQSVNWELIGGVSFRKGCYPGQEVVARMHYRGKPKRRSFVSRLAGEPGSAPAPGADLLVEGAAEPAGMVVASAPAPDGAGLVVLHEALIDEARQGRLRAADGRALEPLPMPYPLPLEADAPAAAQ